MLEKLIFEIPLLPFYVACVHQGVRYSLTHFPGLCVENADEL